MEDFVPIASPDGEAPSGHLDMMNDPGFTPPPPPPPPPSQRRDTASSKAGTDGGLGGETCRICRSEGTSDEPLFYPCKCSGSIKFVHQECLMEWLSHSHKKHCELCKTPFRFTKLYDANMPQTLPWSVFMKRACIHVAQSILRGLRAVLVSLVWLVCLPLVVRLAWRWMFWVFDAGWDRDQYMRKFHAARLAAHAESLSSTMLQNATSAISLTLYSTFEQVWASSFGSVEGASGTSSANMMTGAVKNATADPDMYNANSTRSQADASILSSFTYLSELTPSPKTNRLILDVFEGQLITCVVIIGFILVFLIREWVVQQQPLANLDLDQVLGGDQPPQIERVRRAQERLERDAELLAEADRRLEELQREYSRDIAREDQVEFRGWEATREMIDAADRELDGGSDEQERFSVKVAGVLEQMIAAEDTGTSAKDIAEIIHQKIRQLPVESRVAWETKLVDELKKRRQGQVVPENATFEDSTDLAEGSSSRRPPMPTRDGSSRAAHIQRLLEEADGALNSHKRHSAAASTSDTDGESTTERPNVASAPSSTAGSWQTVSPPQESRSLSAHAGGASQDISDEIPITNAGPDAKVNIKRRGKSRARTVVPEPEEVVERAELTPEELKKRLDERLEQLAARPLDVLRTVDTDAQRLIMRSDSEASNDDGVPPTTSTTQDTTALRFDESAPDGAHVPAEVSEAFRGGLGSTDAQELVDTQVDSGEEIEQPPRSDPATISLFDKLIDWFWGDIQPLDQQEAAPEPVEVQLVAADNAQEAGILPANDNGQLDAANGDDDEFPEHDPEVAAAAQAAGLDAEAAEDAEDLEGIFELIGMQGPLIGLAQTSCFCSVLVVTTVATAIGFPYIFGKLVLLLLKDPVMMLIKMPLQAASVVTDFLVDLALVMLGFIGAGLTAVVGLGMKVMLPLVPHLPGYDTTRTSHNFFHLTGWNAVNRLKYLTAFGNEASAASHGQWFGLKLSVLAHASLSTIQHETRAVLTYTGGAITAVTETLSSGSAAVILDGSKHALALVTQVATKLSATAGLIQSSVEPLMSAIGSLRTGTLTFSTSNTTIVLDPTLVYWNSHDRGITILLGYIALAMVAASYVAADTPVTSSQYGQKTEKMIRDSLRQAGGVLKVIMIISIEMLIFPLYCGLLLDLAFLPLFQSASVATRWAFAMSSPYTFCFVHWFVGTCYMFHFALFVGMCRKILRKGVLWFIRDPDDPTFHPVRDVLERNVATQLRKIAFSALVYGALVILCLGGVIWGIGKVFKGIFPLRWISTEPVLEWPLDLLLYSSITPALFHLARSSKAVHAMYTWWLRRCARSLRLSHFLFDDRRKDEEGHHSRGTWVSFLAGNGDECAKVDADDTFQRDGKFVLTPCNDQYRPPKPGEAFIHVEDDDVYIADKDGKKHEHFAKIYVPPHFRVRVSLFMVCLWIFSAFIGLCGTLLPLCFGRYFFSSFLPAGVMVNDIYAYSIGAYFFGGLLYILLKGASGARYVRDRAASAELRAWLLAVKAYSSRAVKCLYVYGFIGVVMPVVFTMLIQFYVILPLHTFLVANIRPALANAGTDAHNSTVTNVVNATLNSLSASGNSTGTFAQRNPIVTEHSIHLLADSALGWQIMRLAGRTLLGASRATEAFRRVTADGYTNPNARLATRFFVLPATLLSIIILAGPVSLAAQLISLFTWLGWDLEVGMKTVIYRYSYPVLAGWLTLVLGTRQIVKATGRWRARIRDEVYLVGERLHNFGEKRPPVGSRSVDVKR